MPAVDVANPIYDVVFTYLMQNHRVARLLIGRITGLAVQSLTVSPRGTALRRTPEDPEHDLPLTLLRMTFAARVQTRDGSERQVLIEILKANSPTVIERFRRYLDQQIGSGENILTYPSGRTEAVPIVTIYFLGYALDDLSDEAVIDVCARVTERRTGRELAARHPLVEGIHRAGACPSITFRQHGITLTLNRMPLDERRGPPTTPAGARRAGGDQGLEIDDIVRMVEEDYEERRPKTRGPYRKRQS